MSSCEVCEEHGHLVCVDNRNSDELVTVLIEIGNDLETRWSK